MKRSQIEFLMISEFEKIDPRDRKVILVATKEGLIKLASRADFMETTELLPNIINDLPLLKLAKQGKNLLTKINREMYSEKTLSHLMQVLGNQGKDLLFKTKRERYLEKSIDELKKEVDQGLRLSTPPVLISPSDAVRIFKFGVGQTPVDGSIYIQHPIITDAYIDPADFSRTVSKEKEAAFRQLASSLGAKSLVLTNATVRTKRGLLGTTVSLPEAASEIGIVLSLDKSGTFVRKVYSEYGLPRRGPWVPPDLKPWIEMDPDLRTMARDRIEGHLLKNTITLEFKEGIGIGGEIAAKLAGRGFSVSGSYEAICHTIWYFDVEYHPINN